MDERSANESGSEQSRPSSESSVSDSKKNKTQRQCDVCHHYFDEDTMRSGYRANNYTVYSHEYIPHSSYWSSSRKLWICAECYSLTRDPSRTNQVKGSNDQAASSSRTNQAVDNKVVQQKTTCNESATSRTNQAALSSITIQAVDNEVVQQKTTSDSCNEISTTNPPSQTHPRPTVEEASPPMKKQKASDNDAHSDSESAK